MLPFGGPIPRHLARLESYPIDVIAPQELRRRPGDLHPRTTRALVDHLVAELLAAAKLEFLEPVLVQGSPTPADEERLAALAATIAAKHAENNFA
jgi:hypothetical protein